MTEGSLEGGVTHPYDTGIRNNGDKFIINELGHKGWGAGIFENLQYM